MDYLPFEKWSCQSYSQQLRAEDNSKSQSFVISYEMYVIDDTLVRIKHE